MSIADVLKKITAGEELTDEDKGALESFDPSAFVSVEEANSKAAAARKEAEKKLADLTAAHTDLTKQFEAVSANKGTEAEQLQAKVGLLETNLGDMKAQLEAEKKAAEQAKRTGSLRAISSGLKWNRDLVDSDYEMDVLSKQFGDLSVDDLENKDVVGPVLKKLETERPKLFVAEGVGGSGDKSGGGQGGGSKVVASGTDLLQLAQKDPEAARAALDAAHEANRENRLEMKS
jgi:hypothetical protein